MFKTEPFKIKGSKMHRLICSRWFSRSGWLILPPLAALIVCAVSTGRYEWAIVALMYLFIVIPMIFAPVYINYCFRELPRIQTLYHTLTIDDYGKIGIIPVREEPKGKDNDKNDKNNNGYDKTGYTMPCNVIPPIFVESDRITDLKQKGSSLIIITGKSPSDVIVLDTDVAAHSYNHDGTVDAVDNLHEIIIDNYIKRLSGSGRLTEV